RNASTRTASTDGSSDIRRPSRGTLACCCANDASGPPETPSARSVTAVRRLFTGDLDSTSPNDRSDAHGPQALDDLVDDAGEPRVRCLEPEHRDLELL